MGLFQSRESYLAKEKESPRLNRDTLRFPGFKEKDEKFLKHQKETKDVFDKMTDIVDKLVSFAGLPDAVGYLLKATKSLSCYSINPSYYSNLENAMLELKMEKMVVNTVHSLLKAEMESIERQLNLINDPQISNDQKRNHLVTADDSCYKLLVKFCDKQFYLRQNPLVFAPFLMSFVAVYVPIATANYRLTPTEKRKQDYTKNMQDLQDTVEHFMKVAVKERQNYVQTNYPSLEETPFLTDEFLDKNRTIHFLFTYSPDVFDDVYNWYRDKVGKKYAEYFKPGLRALETLKISPMANNSCYIMRRGRYQ